MILKDTAAAIKINKLRANSKRNGSQQQGSQNRFFQL